MFQNKKLKCNATCAIAEVAEVALCDSNCAFPTSGRQAGRRLINITSLNHTKLLEIAHLNSLGLYWDEIDRHIETNL